MYRPLPNELTIKNSPIEGLGLFTNEDIKAFHENGFLIKEKFLQEKYISLLLSKFDPLFKGEFPNGIAPDEWNWVHGKDSRYLTRQICNAWKSDDLIRDLVCHELIGRILANLMGWPGSRILQDNILFLCFPENKPLSK